MFALDFIQKTMQTVQYILVEFFRYFLINNLFFGIFISLVFLSQANYYSVIHRLFGILLILLSFYSFELTKNYIHLLSFLPIGISDAFDLIFFIGPAYYVLMLSIYGTFRNVHFLHYLLALVIFILFKTFQDKLCESVLKESLSLIYISIYFVSGNKRVFKLRYNFNAIFTFYLSQSQLFYKRISFLVPLITISSLTIFVLIRNFWGVIISTNLVAVIFYYSLTAIFSQKHPILDRLNNKL